MHLLSADSYGGFHLTTFPNDCTEHGQEYAILSHRWLSKEEEVTYHDICNGTGRNKAGYKKLVFCADQAHKDGLQYFWVDTCCINKDNNEELSEAITCMYRWYEKSTLCYVYLADVKQEMGLSQWFKRGWTLQELMAPASVKFFNKDSAFLGGRAELADIIVAATTIEKEALMRERTIDQFSVQQRFHWALHRQTERQEDAAYCLLGIFNVSMLPHYGEGRQRAFDRLKREICYRFQIDVLQLPTEDKPSQPPLEPPTSDFDDRNMRRPATPSSQVPIPPRLPSILRLQHTEQTWYRDSHPSARRLCERRASIIALLGFDDMDIRRAAIDRPHAHSCEWLFQDSSFLEWHSRQDGFIWIKAHPGAGKSTLMKYADYCISAELAEGPDVLISFYFNARGDQLEKSVSGMYRSLIVQLMYSIAGLEYVLDRLRFGRSVLPNLLFFKDPPIVVLEEIFAQCLKDVQGRHIFCMIDALDEADENDVLRMVKFLQAVAHQDQLSVCFASRHYPTLDLPIRLQLTVDDHHGHLLDIERYIVAELHVLQDASMREQILKRSNGIFLWVVLVVAILNKECRSGTLLAVQQKLKELPTELVKLLARIVEQGDVEIDHFILCLQWILHAKRPLALDEFYFAMLAGMQRKPLQLLFDGTLKVDSHQKRLFLITHSKGLAEAVGSKEDGQPRVQFIHESIREYLLGGAGLRILCRSARVQHEGDTNDIIAQHCWQYYRSGDELWRNQEASGVHTEWVLERRYFMARFLSPFFSYTIEYIFEHFESSSNPELQEKFCRDFDFQGWRPWAISVCYLLPIVEDCTFPRALELLECRKLFKIAQRLDTQGLYGAVDGSADDNTSKVETQHSARRVHS